MLRRTAEFTIDVLMLTGLACAAGVVVVWMLTGPAAKPESKPKRSRAHLRLVRSA